jgi:hypothetical protein
MSNAEPTAPKQRVIGVPFKPGQSGNPAGRPKSSRNRLSEDFVRDLSDAWQRHGVQALDTVAIDDPSTFVRVIAQLMPRDVNLSVAIDPTAFAARFNTALELLGNDPEPPRQRRSLRAPLKVIEHER